MRVAEALRDATAALEASSDTARLDAEVLMAHALGVSRSQLLVRHMSEPVPVGFAAMLERRLTREPVAYITGHREFCGLDLAVTPDVLIPRGDSEVLVEAALAAQPGASRVLDCGTGSGALLLAVLAALPGATGIGIDRSQAALRIALANAAALGIAGATFLERDWCEPGWAGDLGAFDLVLANPPYVEQGAALDPDVRDFEPEGALFAGPDGLDAYRALLPQVPELLRPGGMAFVEIGAHQGSAVSTIAAGCGMSAILHRDLAGRPRGLQLQAR